MPVTAEEYFEKRPLRDLLAMPDAYLDQAMAQAFQLFSARRYDEAEIMCRGILAADPKYWYAYALHAMTLVRRGRLDEALSRVEKALAYEPAQEKLLGLMAEIRQLQMTVGEIRARAATLRASRPGAAAPIAAPAVSKNLAASAARAEVR
jgi:tetratricopeptide (TPR) repeat protein